MKKLTMGIALANLKLSDIEKESIYHEIETSLLNIHTYELKPKPDKIAVAAFDYVIAINTVGSIFTIAQVLWSVYKRLIAPKQKPGKQSGLYIVIDIEDRRNQFWIGNEYTDENTFVKDFTHHVTKYQQSSETHKLDQVLHDIQSSDDWVRRI